MSRPPVGGAVVVMALVLGVRPAAAQFSPGPLSRPHASLEGSTRCGQCHEARRGVSAERCLSCHRALAARVSAGEGLHARPEYRDCKTCHVDHQGPEYELVWWGDGGPESFDHGLTGHVLEGAHVRVECRRCHQPRLTRMRDPPPALAVNPERTYLGLGAECTSCHADSHRGEFPGQGCTSCHTQVAWRPAPGFDHAKTSWPLTGRHSRVACARCHEGAVSPGADPAVRFVAFGNTAGRECSSCHRDVHRAKLGTACSTCHSTDGWQGVARARFDHERTGYPLEGRHADVPCDRCHRSGGPRPLRHERCTDCHLDSHLGQLASRADHGACESCHDVRGFVPALYGVEDHQKTGYPLEGGHLAVACNACHSAVTDQELRRTPGIVVPREAPGRGPRLHFASTRCEACHRDAHRGELDRWVKASGCEGCHDKEAWRRARFDHAQTRFALVGGHARAACGDCHRRVEADTPHERTGFAGTPLACEMCHVDTHRGQFVAAGAEVACDRCHSARTLEASRFDHARSAWALDGAHLGVPCAQCHRRETRAGVSFVRYKPLPTTCGGCHGPTRPQGKDVVSR